MQCIEHIDRIDCNRKPGEMLLECNAVYDPQAGDELPE